MKAFGWSNKFRKRGQGIVEIAGLITRHPLSAGVRDQWRKASCTCFANALPVAGDFLPEKPHGRIQRAASSIQQLIANPSAWKRGPRLAVPSFFFAPAPRLRRPLSLFSVPWFSHAKRPLSRPNPQWHRLDLMHDRPQLKPAPRQRTLQRLHGPRHCPHEHHPWRDTRSCRPQRTVKRKLRS